MMRQIAAQMTTRNEIEAARFLNNLAAEIGRNLVPVDNFKANLQKDAALAGLNHNSDFVNTEKINEPEKTVAEKQENYVSENRSENTATAPTTPEDDSAKRWINQSLAEIAESLRSLEDIVYSRLQPSNPLWYMDVLERAQTNLWVLTTEEVEDLIGVKPRCEAGKNSYQRGCWVFVKVGKMGSHTGWRVMKEEVEVPEEVAKSELHN